MQTVSLVDEYLKSRQGQLSDSTLKETTRVLGKFAAACPELPQRPEPIFKFLGTLGNAPSSREKYRKLLSGFYTWASSMDGIVNPMPDVKVPQRRAKVSRAEPVTTPAPALAHVYGGGQPSVAPDQVETIALRVAALLSRNSSASPTDAALSAAGPQLLTAQAVKDFIDELEHGAKQLSPKTVHTYYEKYLKQFAAAYEFLPMDPGELGRFIGTGQSRNERYIYSRVLSYFYKTLSRRYGWKRLGIFNPTEEMQKVGPKHAVVPPLQAEEIEKMLGVLRLEEPDTRAIVLLFLSTGIRPVEVYTLKASSFYGTQIQVSGKTEARMVTLLSPLKDALAELYPAGNPEAPVFQRLQVKVPVNTIDRSLDKVMLAAGVRGGHGGGRLFRHTFACWLYSETNDPFLVQQVLGHTTLQMSRRYAKMRMPRTAEAPLWYELIKAATACHKMESPVISDQLQALIRGQEYHPKPLFKELSPQFAQTYGEKEKNKSRRVEKKPSLVQATFDQFLEGEHGQTEELARR